MLVILSLGLGIASLLVLLAVQVHRGQRRITMMILSEDDAEEGLRAAMFHFQSMGARVLNGRVRAVRTPDGAGREVWEFEDAGRWLW